MKITKYTSILALLALLTACHEDPVTITPSTDDLIIHTIEQLNIDDERLDSHAGEEAYSILEPVYKYRQVIPPSVFGIAKPQYVRVKKLADSTFLMIYHEAGNNVLISRSTDLIEWTKGEQIFTVKTAITDDGSDKRKYTSPDATVLANGDVLAYCSFHLNKGYKAYPEMNGVMMRRSTDNGKTWGKEMLVYQGTNWEPYILQLPSGELNCYFTDTDPVLRNSGTSMVVSTDNGETWTPTGTSQCYKVIRQYKYDTGTARIYTDQMPVIRMLNDGHTLLGFMEARIEDDRTVNGNSYYFMSVVYGKDSWAHLEGDEVGPADRKTNLGFGGSGYVGQFRSGETLISCARSNMLSIKVGSADGRIFRGSNAWGSEENWSSDSWNADASWYMPFRDEKGISGSMEVIDTHEMVAVQHMNVGGVVIGKFYLNHRIDAPEQMTKVDGNNKEWLATQALFLGSECEAQTAIRAAHDSDNLYLLVERSDKYVDADDRIELLLQGGSTESLTADALKLTVMPEQDALIERYADGTWASATIEGVECKTVVKGIVGDGRSDTGYLCEIAIPLSQIGVTDKTVSIDAVMYDRDCVDTFTDVDAAEPKNWMKISIK